LLCRNLPATPRRTLIVELADPWSADHEALLQQRRGHRRRRAAGAGPKRRLAFCDRVLITLAVLRLQLPHQAVAVLYGVNRSTVTRAVHEVRPLLAARGFAVPGQPGLRLRTLADVVAYADACGIALRIDTTETRVRRPQAHRPGRRAFVSGKRKQNTIKATTCSDGHGRTLWSGAMGPGRMHDQTAAKTEGIADLLGQRPTVRVWVDEGYRGLATAFPDQVHAPPRKPPKVEHAVAEHKLAVDPRLRYLHAAYVGCFGMRSATWPRSPCSGTGRQLPSGQMVSGCCWCWHGVRESKRRPAMI
jgi:hypothetical protein